MKKAETIIPIKIMARTLKLIAIFVAVSYCRLKICEGVFALLGSKSGKFREGNGSTLRSVMNMVSTALWNIISSECGVLAVFHFSRYFQNLESVDANRLHTFVIITLASPGGGRLLTL